MSERREQLLHAVDHLIEVWNQWSADSDLNYITREFEEAVDDCLLVFAHGTIPGDLRSMTHSVDTLAEHWQAWHKRNEETAGKVLLPGNGFWAALEEIAAARHKSEQPTVRHLESIAQLDAQKVPDAQICRIYGFTTADGHPRMDILQQERAEPGKHTGPGTGWKPPHQRRQEEKNRRHDEALERVRQNRAAKIRHLQRVAPETIEELVGQGVSGNQICRMKKIDRDELETYCREHSLEVKWLPEGIYGMAGEFDYRPGEEPEKNVDPPVAGEDADGYLADNPLGEPIDDPAAEGQATNDSPGKGSKPAKSASPQSPTPETPLTLDQQIVEQAKAGTPEEQIAKAVSRPDATVSVGKIRAVLKRWKKDPAAFEPAGGDPEVAKTTKTA